MAATPEFVIDVLNDLLDAETNNVFRTVERVSPSLAKADPAIRESVAELKRLAGRHARELSELIVRHGGVPTVEREHRPGDQNMAFVSLSFLLPKLVAEKDLILTRYENAKQQLGDDYPEITDFLSRIEGEQRHYLEVLGTAAERQTGGRYTAPPHEQPRRPAKGR